MSIKRVKTYLEKFGRETDILEMPSSTATVQLAAEALGIIPARIAKSIALKGLDDRFILLVTAGDTKLDNKNFKSEFGLKPKMLSVEETLEIIGHAIGGVCPFAVTNRDIITVALDESLKRFETVYPACGSSNSAIEVTIDQLSEYVGEHKWVNACKDWD